MVLGVNKISEHASAKGLHDYVMHIGQAVTESSCSCMPFLFQSAAATGDVYSQ